LADGHENADGGTGQLGSTVTAIIHNSIDFFLNPIHEHKPQGVRCRVSGVREEKQKSPDLNTETSVIVFWDLMFCNTQLLQYSNTPEVKCRCLPGPLLNS
jgi:hypothetical protein